MAKKSTAVATRETGTDIDNRRENVFTKFARAASATVIIGSLLKFSKGDWTHGQDDDAVDEGTKLVVNMDSIMYGWQRWEDNRPAEQIMGLLVEGYTPPKRDTLGHTEKNEWETDDSGKPRDPFQETYMVLLKEPGKSGDLFTYSATSRGARDAISKLCGEYGKEMWEHQDEYPIVELGVSSYKHKVKSYGTIKTPTFSIVGWEKKAVFNAVHKPAK